LDVEKLTMIMLKTHYLQRIGDFETSYIENYDLYPVGHFFERSGSIYIVNIWGQGTVVTGVTTVPKPKN
jgi:hypothetical protein